MIIDMNNLIYLVESFCRLSPEIQNQIKVNILIENLKETIKQENPKLTEEEKSELLYQRLEYLVNFVEEAEKKLSSSQRDELLNHAQKLYNRRKQQQMCGCSVEIKIKTHKIRI